MTLQSRPLANSAIVRDAPTNEFAGRVDVDVREIVKNIADADRTEDEPHVILRLMSKCTETEKGYSSRFLHAQHEPSILHLTSSHSAQYRVSVDPLQVITENEEAAKGTIGLSDMRGLVEGSQGQEGAGSAPVALLFDGCDEG